MSKKKQKCLSQGFPNNVFQGKATEEESDALNKLEEQLRLLEPRIQEAIRGSGYAEESDQALIIRTQMLIEYYEELAELPDTIRINPLGKLKDYGL